MTATSRAGRGAKAETEACRFLENHGLRCIDRNVRCRFGEIDLVMQAAELLVFVEVRFRRHANPVSAIESVDARKQRKLALAAAWYVSRTRQFQGCNIRFDVIAIDGRPQAQSALQWIKDAFRPGA